MRRADRYVTDRFRVLAGGWISVLGAGVALLLVHPPGAGSGWPACPIHAVTGLDCPGCGMTRATFELAQGHVGAALSYNALAPLWWSTIAALPWLLRRHDRPITRWVVGVLIVVALSFMLVRNV